MLNTFKQSLIKAINVSRRNISMEDIDKLFIDKLSTKMIEEKIYRSLNEITSGGSMYTNPKRISVAREMKLLMFLYTELKIKNNKIQYILYLLNSISNWEYPEGSLIGKESFINYLFFIKVGSLIEAKSSDTNEKFKVIIESREDLFTFNIKRVFEDGYEDKSENVSFSEILRLGLEASK